MKKIVMFILLFIGMQGFAQGVMYLSDPYIVNQTKRDVYHSWAKFTPEQQYKKIMGVKFKVLTPSFETAWAAWAPKQNSRYRRGKDIRPLSEKGDLTAVTLSTVVNDEIDKKYEEKAKKLGDSSLAETAYYTTISGTIPEPFWELFYKKYLHEAKSFINAEDYIYEQLNNSGFDEHSLTKWGALKGDEQLKSEFERDMKIFKERINSALSVDMERGHRIINIHNIFLEYTAYKNRLHGELEFLVHLYNNKQVKDISKGSGRQNFKFSTERELMRQIILDSKLNYNFRR